MAKSPELKTQATKADVGAFIEGLAEARRPDCRAVVELMERASGEKPVMWGPAIVGFGDYRYQYASGRENDWFMVGFSPRAADLTFYLIAPQARSPEFLDRLGKHKVKGSCLHIKKLADVDQGVLEEMVRFAADEIRAGRVRF